MMWKTQKWIFHAYHSHYLGLKHYFIIVRCELLTESQIFLSIILLMSHRTKSGACSNKHFKPRYDFNLNVWFQESHFC